MRTGAARAGDTLQDTAPAHPPLTPERDTPSGARLLQIVEQREPLRLHVGGLRGLKSGHLQVELADRARVVGVLHFGERTLQVDADAGVEIRLIVGRVEPRADPR